MECEVVVVGAGIGGLATAALLAARGMDVCVFERQSRGGGCVANFEHLGYTFEPTAGLYFGWEPGGTFDKLFSPLPVDRPQVRRLSPAYIVRLPDQNDIGIFEDSHRFAETLRRVFPECADAASSFYHTAGEVGQRGSSVLPNASQPATAYLAQTSPRFQRFIDLQLQTFTQRTTETCPIELAALALTASMRGAFTLSGGGQALADRLASAITASGATVRLNSPVLRLAYDSTGVAVGVDLLSGERVFATRAIVSNLTIWDTYGKLIGPGRTPKAIAAQLKQLTAWGAYLIFASMDEAAVSRLKANHFLVLSDWGEGIPYAPDQMQFVLSVATEFDTRAPADQRAVTICSFAEADEWFSFHQDETAHEVLDQTTLESVWNRLHSSMPELGDSIEVIETATPRTIYETTRRRLGMVGAPISFFENPAADRHSTSLPNVFMIGDTVCEGFGLEGVCSSAMALANRIAGD
jgi:phytoene dehydrogenase-like protein